MENYLKHRIIDTVTLKNGKIINIHNDISNNDKINDMEVIESFSADNKTELKKQLSTYNFNEVECYCFPLDRLYSKGFFYMVRILKK